MSVMLLKAAGAAVTGAAAPARGLDWRIRAQKAVVGGAWIGDTVTVQYSLSTEQDDWKTLGTITNVPGADLTVDFPVERLRAKTGASMTDTVDVLAAPGAVCAV